jgi:hypothetical protein
LKKARVAPDTATIAKIAIELFKRIREQEQGKQEKGEQQEQGEPPVNINVIDGDKPTAPSDKQGDEKGDKPSDKPSDGQGDEQGDGDGQPSDGQPSDEQGEGDEPSDGNGDGYSNEEYDGGREVEPSDFIQGELEKVSKSSDAVSSRPSVGKPRIETFHWR